MLTGKKKNRKSAPAVLLEWATPKQKQKRRAETGVEKHDEAVDAEDAACSPPAPKLSLPSQNARKGSLTRFAKEARQEKLIVWKDKETGETRVTKELEAWTWNTSAEHFEWPELSDTIFGLEPLQAKENFAICLSGGGSRATTCALGWLRAFYLLGFFMEARYVASNSGASMVNAPSCIQDKYSFDQFFGPYFPPDQCTKARMKRVALQGLFARAIEDATTSFNGFLKKSIKGDKRSWGKTVGKAFLKPFQLYDPKTTIGVEQQHSVNQFGKHLRKRFTVDGTKPIPIINCTMLFPEDEMIYHPFEFTPLYCGSPVQREINGEMQGGFLMEPQGFNSAKPVGVAVPKEEAATVECMPRYVVPLSAMIGASSSFLPILFCKNPALQNLFGFEKFEYWNPHTNESSLFTVGDGGGFDNLAIFSLLRRKVEKVVCCFAADVKDYSEDEVKLAAQIEDVSAMFGRCPPKHQSVIGISGELYNKRNQVFPDEGYDALIKGLQECEKAGKPLTHRGKYKVLDNKYAGVEGGWEVSVLWVFNGRCAEWEDQLPTEIKHQIDHDRESKLVQMYESMTVGKVVSLAEFPCVSTSEFRMTSTMIGLLSNMSSYTIHSVKDDIQELIRDGF